MKNSLGKTEEPRLEQRDQGERTRVPTPGLPGASTIGSRLTEGEAGTLCQRELEYYLFVVESSLHVRKTHQFFVWAQGALQSLLPHEVLFCVHGDFNRRELSVSRCTGAPFPDQQFAEICHPEHGLVAKVIAAWRRNWEAPCLFSSGGGVHPQVELLMARYGFPNLACHGAQGVNGSGNTCFIFARFPRTPGPRKSYELELLHWVSEGKSNHQIGDALRISPLTVKNHIQNILKKLEVQNRAQAVSRAISLKLIGSQPVR